MSELRKQTGQNAGVDARKEVSAEGPILSEATREWIARYKRPVVEPVDPIAYREAVEGLIALGGSDPDAWAPPRRRFW